MREKGVGRGQDEGEEEEGGRMREKGRGREGRTRETGGRGEGRVREAGREGDQGEGHFSIILIIREKRKNCHNKDFISNYLVSEQKRFRVP